LFVDYPDNYFISCCVGLRLIKNRQETNGGLEGAKERKQKTIIMIGRRTMLPLHPLLNKT
jgi:hypothetical protein